MAIRKSPEALEAAAKLSRDSMLEAAKPKRLTLPTSSSAAPTRSMRLATTETPDRGPFVFVAYAREDASPAAQVVAALRAHGIRVEWDQDLLGGQHFRLRLGEMISKATVVMVLWSQYSTCSDFVIDEAEAGKSAGKLVTCRLGDLEACAIPFGFRQLHCVSADDTPAILAALAGCGLETTSI